MKKAKTNSPEILNKLRKFCRFKRLKKIVISYLASRIKQSDEQQFKRNFLNIDKDNDGYIDLEELHQYCNMPAVGVEELKKMMSMVDLDFNKKINYTGKSNTQLLEFIAATMDSTHFARSNTIKTVFNTFDKVMKVI